MTISEITAGRVSLEVGGPFEVQPAGATFAEALTEARTRSLPLALVSWARHGARFTVSVRCYFPDRTVERRLARVRVDEDDVTMTLLTATLRLYREVIEAPLVPPPAPYVPGPDPLLAPIPPATERPRATPIPRGRIAH